MAAMRRDMRAKPCEVITRSAIRAFDAGDMGWDVSLRRACPVMGTSGGWTIQRRLLSEQPVAQIAARALAYAAHERRRATSWRETPMQRQGARIAARRMLEHVRDMRSAVAIASAIACLQVQS